MFTEKTFPSALLKCIAVQVPAPKSNVIRGQTPTGIGSFWIKLRQRL